MVFQLGDKVQPYAQTSLVNRPFPKLSMKYYVPYTVLERIGPAAYKLDPTFHVSQLKAYTPDHTPVFSELPPLISLDGTDVVPEAILDRQLVKKGNAPIPQILLKWSKLPSTSATWEDLYIVQQRFPDALAWDKQVFQGGQML